MDCGIVSKRFGLWWQIFSLFSVFEYFWAVLYVDGDFFAHSWSTKKQKSELFCCIIIINYNCRIVMLIFHLVCSFTQLMTNFHLNMLKIQLISIDICFDNNWKLEEFFTSFSIFETLSERNEYLKLMCENLIFFFAWEEKVIIRRTSEICVAFFISCKQKMARFFDFEFVHFNFL